MNPPQAYCFCLRYDLRYSLAEINLPVLTSFTA